MTTDPTLYDEEGRLQAKDIEVTTYHPSGDGRLVIDLNLYYDGLCCYELVAVESRRSAMSDGVFITPDRRRVVYELHGEPEHWSKEGAMDRVRYVLLDHATGQTAVGHITIRRIEHGAFSAKDVHLTIPLGGDGDDRWPRIEPLRLDLALVNKLPGVRIVELGDFDSRIFSSVGINADRQSELVFEAADKCPQICGGRTTEVEYAIEAEVDGVVTVSKAKVIFRFADALFYAEFIEVELPFPLPASVVIDLAGHNGNFAHTELTAVDTSTPAGRGSVTAGPGAMEVTYAPNPHSGYWDDPDAADMLPYTLTNLHTGQTASSYIVVRRAAPGDFNDDFNDDFGG
jgi:hypothetical protein